MTSINLVGEREDRIIEDKAAKIETQIREWRDSNTRIAKRRWIFELLQNAIDSAVNKFEEMDDKKLKIKLSRPSENKIKFEHNGGYFTGDELLALIDGGSSKIDNKALTGKFGSGFLVSHILGRTLEVRTKLDSGNQDIREISFKLERGKDENRTSKNKEKIKENSTDQIENLQEEINKKIDVDKKIEDDDYHTCFEYHSFKDKLINDAYEKGKDSLKKILPAFFAFNEKEGKEIIESIKIDEEEFILDKNVKKETLNSDKGIKKVKVNYGDSYKCFYYIDNYENNSMVGFFTKKKNDFDHTREKVVRLNNDHPRFFVKGQPLINNATVFDIPFIINSNSDDFKPDKRRTKIAGNENDKKIFKKCIDYYEGLVNEIAQKEIDNKEFSALYNLFSYEIDHEGNYEEDTTEEIEKKIRNKIKKMTENENITVVKNHEGNYEYVSGVQFLDRTGPKEELNSTEYLTFHEICISFASRVFPDKEIMDDWKEVVKKLKNEIPDNNITIYNLNDLKDDLQKNESFKDIQKKYLGEKTTGQELTEKFFRFCNKLYKNKKIGHGFIEKMLPVQNGKIKNKEKNDLKIEDGDIDNDLINIGKELGYNLESKLIHRKFKNLNIVSKNFDDYFGELKAIEAILEECKEPKEGYLEGVKSIENLKNIEDPENNIEEWIKFFIWCLVNDRLENSNIPWISKNNKIKEIKNTNSKDVEEESLIFIPLKYMLKDEEFSKIKKYTNSPTGEDLEIYVDDYLLNDLYFEFIEDLDFIYEDEDKPNKNFKDDLKENGPFVIDLPMEKKSVGITKPKLKSILKEDTEISNGKHNIKIPQDDETSIKILPKWNSINGRFTGEKGEENAKNFFIILYGHFVEKENWDQTVTVECECEDGEHTISPPFEWLAKVKNDRWVPSKSTSNEDEKTEKLKALKGNLEKLFEMDSKSEESKSDRNKFNKILKNLGNDLSKSKKFLEHFQFDILDLSIKFNTATNRDEKNIREGLSTIVDQESNINELSTIIKKHDLDEIRKAVESYQEKSGNRNAKYNKKIGKKVEDIIQNIIENYGLEVDNRYKGFDLQVRPKPDKSPGLVEIENELIEVKFTTKSSINLSKSQVDMARDEGENYSLLVVEGDKNLKDRIGNDEIDKSILKEIKNNSFVVDKISKHLGEKPEEGITINLNGAEVRNELWEEKDGIGIKRWIGKNFNFER